MELEEATRNMEVFKMSELLVGAALVLIAEAVIATLISVESLSKKLT